MEMYIVTSDIPRCKHLVFNFTRFTRKA